MCAQAYVNAINSGVENIQDALLSPTAQKQLVSTGPRLVHHSQRARKTIDTEDTDLKCLAQPDGTFITEKHQTTEHEEFVDDELPEKDDHSTGSRERIEHNVSYMNTLVSRMSRCVFSLLLTKLRFSIFRSAALHATVFEASG